MIGLLKRFDSYIARAEITTAALKFTVACAKRENSAITNESSG
jgi:hypothetical protein